MYTENGQHMPHIHLKNIYDEFLRLRELLSKTPLHYYHTESSN